VGILVAGQDMNNVTIIAATPADRDDLFAWRNDPGTRHASKNTAAVGWETHVEWFASTLASPDRTVYIGYSESNKIGSVRFDRIGRGDTFLVSIVIAPAQRGCGFGKGLLGSAIVSLPNATLKAEIAKENIASRRIFEACGFLQVPADTNSEFLHYRRAPAVQLPD
jgi:RimJ/RimL family protein N-acetyltransferase